jgi:hypothetical protein
MKTRGTSLVVITVLGLGLSRLSYADQFTQAQAEIQADSVLISQWMSDQLRTAVPYNSTSGNVTPSQLKLFGVDFGVTGLVSATSVDLPALRNLGTQLVDTSKISAPNRLPFPMILGHAKLGLPCGFDVGVRLGGIPATTFDKDDTHIKVKNKVFGLDLRKALVKEGLGVPGLTLGLNYTHSDGEIDWTTPFSFNKPVSFNGNTYNASSSNAATDTTSKWQTNSVGLQALLHKKLLFLTPYVGGSVNRNDGHINSSIQTAGDLILTQNGNPPQTETLDETGSANSAVEKWDVRALAGVEFSILPFFRLGLNGDFAGSRKVGASLDLRFQFR